MRSGFVAIAVGVVLGLGGAASAGWVPRTLAGGATSFSYQPTLDVAVGPGGTAVAGWLDETTGVPFASVRRAGVWGAARKIYTPGANEFVSEIRVAVGGDGTALAATVTSHFERGLAFDVVKASLLPAAATAWAAPTELSPRLRGTGAVRTGLDRAGNGLVLWRQPGAAVSLKQSVRPAGGAWSAAQDVAPPGTAGPFLDFAMSPSGAAAAVWTTPVGGSTVIRTLTRLPDGTWLPPTDAVTPAVAPWAVHVAVDAQARLALVWAGDGIASLLRQSAPGAWDPAVTLNEAPWSASAPDVDLDEQGDLAVVWSESDPATWIYRLHAQVRRLDGTLTDSAWEPPSGGPLSLPTVALGPDGALAAVAWVDEGTGDAWAASLFAPTALWSAPARLGPLLWGNAVALSAGPFACAAWPAPSTREFVISLRAATLDPAYPVPVLGSVSPSIVKLGTPVPSLAVSGTGFVTAFGTAPGSVLTWDGAGLPTDFVSPTSLSVPLSSAETESEGSHLVQVVNPGPGGGTSVARTVLVDGTAPATAASLTGTAGANGWWTSAVKVTLASQDNLSGIGSLASRLDTAAPVVRSYTPTNPPTLARQATLTVSGSLVHRLEFAATDAAGNAEVALVQTIPIDVTPPAVSAAAAPRTLAAAPGVLASVKVSGSATDTLSGLDPASATFAVADEYGEVQPSGAVALAANGAYAFVVPLLAERRADDANGRTYTITVTARDRAGLARSRAVAVTVN